MFDQAQQDQAKAEGWRLVTTFENGDTHPLFDITPSGSKFRDGREVTLAVIDAAKRGGALHQHALRLVTSSRVRAPKGTKK